MGYASVSTIRPLRRRRGRSWTSVLPIRNLASSTVSVGNSDRRKRRMPKEAAGCAGIWSVHRFHAVHQGEETFGQCGMYVDRSLQQRIRQVPQHQRVEYVNQFASLACQNRCAEYSVICCVDYDFHEPCGLVQFNGARHPRHRDFADFQVVARRPGFLFRHTYAAELRGCENAIRNDAMVDREMFPLRQIRIDDLKIVIRDMCEGGRALYIPER